MATSASSRSGSRKATRASSRRSARTPTAMRRAMREHERSVQQCNSCALHEERTTAVVGSGPIDARLVVVAAVPRRHEDLHGEPLSGGPRNVLDAAMTDVGLDPAQVRVTTVVRCRPQDDRAPELDEIRACGSHLRNELNVVAPEVIVTLGAMPTSVVMGRSVPLDRVAGYRLDVLNGITLVPTFPPGDAMRGAPQAVGALKRDLSVAKAVLDGRMSTGAEAMAQLRARV